MAYFGRPHVQPVMGSVKGYPGFQIIHRDKSQDEVEAHLGHKMNSSLWQDVGFERQPQDTSCWGYWRAQMLVEIRCLQRPPTRIGKYFHMLPFPDGSQLIFQSMTEKDSSRPPFRV